MFWTPLFAGKFAAAKLSQQMLPMPTARLPTHAFQSDAGQMKQDSMGLIHGDLSIRILY
jgi:hypothetical protein